MGIIKNSKKTSQEEEIERYNRERDKWEKRKIRWNKWKKLNKLLT